ncbi:hypothetical protein F4774DRAFT_38552 [Daldinia eschscholtzii]|nr:hypothetical protein F4774DRAFT_38552 [Daldinia eschscholtzii]
MGILGILTYMYCAARSLCVMLFHLDSLLSSVSSVLITGPCPCPFAWVFGIDSVRFEMNKRSDRLVQMTDSLTFKNFQLN